MKRILICLLLIGSMWLSAQNTMTIDSVRILPQNPTALDSVYLHIYWHSPWGTMMNTPNVMSGGNNHTAMICYTVGMTTIFMQIHDSVFLFQGPAGMHMVAWSIAQNSSQNTQCDWYLGSNQEAVNVVATGITDISKGRSIQWNSSTDILTLEDAGGLTIYNSCGQLLWFEMVYPGTSIPIEHWDNGFYFASLSKENGETETMQFILQ